MSSFWKVLLFPSTTLFRSHSFSAWSDEKCLTCICITGFCKERTSGADMVCTGCQGVLSYGHYSLPVTLPCHGNLTRPEIQIINIEGDQFAQADPCRIEKFQDGPILPSPGCTRIDHFEKIFHFCRANGDRKTLLFFGNDKQMGGIAFDIPSFIAILEKRAYSGCFSGDTIAGNSFLAQFPHPEPDRQPFDIFSIHIRRIYTTLVRHKM